MSNQRPSSIAEFKHTKDRKGAKYLSINSTRICDACLQNDRKKSIDWNVREKKLALFNSWHLLLQKIE